MLHQFHHCFRVSVKLKVAQNVNATGQSFRSKKQPIFLCVFFSLTIMKHMKQRIPLWICCCPLPICYNSFWYAVAFTEQRCLFDKCGFLLTQYCGHKRTKIVFYWIAGGVYWSAVAFTNPLVSITDPQRK